MALSVPLSRFTSQVGGGSAFYVRPKPYARFGVTDYTMKKTVALILTASTLFLAGCCTTHQATVWEYKTVGSDRDVNQLASQGWTLAYVIPLAGFARDTLNFERSDLRYVMKHPKQ